MARGQAARLREQAVELLALGDRDPAAVAKALGVSEDVLRGWRRKRAFNNAVLARARELLREAMPFVLRRMIEQAEQGHPNAQKMLLAHLEYLETREAEKSSEQWRVTWSATPPVPPAAAKPESDGDE